MRRTTSEKVGTHPARRRVVRICPCGRRLRELQLTRSDLLRLVGHRYTQRGRAGLEPQPGRRSAGVEPDSPVGCLPARISTPPWPTPSSRREELAMALLSDREGHFLSESSVYRILKAYDLIPSPAYVVLSAAKTFQHPT